MKMDTIGKIAMFAVLADPDLRSHVMEVATSQGYRVCFGQAGSMDLKKIVAAIETASRREGLTKTDYPEDHALWHATLDALQGMARGQLQLGSLLRTAGVRFAIVRGYKDKGKPDLGEWIAVALYGHIGGPIEGNEHEVAGLGISHL